MSDFAERIDHPDMRALYAHWRTLSPGVPARANFDPFDIPAQMPHLFMMDVMPEGRFRYRLVGTALDQHIGRPFTGRYLDEMRAGRTLSDLRELFATAAREGVPGYYVSRLASESQPLATYRRLVMPLAEPDGSIAVLLGGFRVEWTSDHTARGEMSFARREERDGRLLFGTR